MDIDTLHENMNEQLLVINQDIRKILTRLTSNDLSINALRERVDKLEGIVKNLPEDMDTKI